MAYCVCRTDKLAGTRDDAALVNLKLHAKVENGNVVVVGARAEGEREAYVSETPTAAAKLDQIALVCEPEVMYDDRKKNLNEFVNEAGSIARGYVLHNGDEFSLTAEGFDGTPKKGAKVELQAGLKLKAVDSATSGSTSIGEITDVEGEYFVIRVKA